MAEQNSSPKVQANRLFQTYRPPYEAKLAFVSGLNNVVNGDQQNAMASATNKITKYPAALVKFFAVGLAISVVGLLALAAGLFNSTHLIQICGAFFLAIGTTLISLTLIRGQAIVDRT